jgi:hypothetical protein
MEPPVRVPHAAACLALRAAAVNASVSVRKLPLPRLALGFWAAHQAPPQFHQNLAGRTAPRPMRRRQPTRRRSWPNRSRTWRTPSWCAPRAPTAFSALLLWRSEWLCSQPLVQSKHLHRALTPPNAKQPGNRPSPRKQTQQPPPWQDEDFSEAARLAFQLRHPGRLLSVLRAQGPAAAGPTARALVRHMRGEDLKTALEYCRWGSNMRDLGRVLGNALSCTLGVQFVPGAPCGSWPGSGPAQQSPFSFLFLLAWRLPFCLTGGSGWALTPLRRPPMPPPLAGSGTATRATATWRRRC